MEELILNQTKGKTIEDVDEIILDLWRGSCISTEDKELLETYSNLDFLSFTGCGLNSLQNFPYLPSLFKLELSENHIKDGLDNITLLTEIMQLSLAGNQIAKLDDLKPLTKLPNLVCLELLGNPIAEIPDYSKKIFGMFSSLQILDGCDINGDEVSIATNEDEEGLEEEDLADLLDEDEDSGEENEIEGEEEEEESEEELPIKRPAQQSESEEESEEEPPKNKHKKHK